MYYAHINMTTYYTKGEHVLGLLSVPPEAVEDLAHVRHRRYDTCKEENPINEILKYNK